MIGGSKTPAVPPPPPPPPPAPTRDDAVERVRDQDAIRKRRGRASTMLAEDGVASTATKTLLGN